MYYPLPLEQAKTETVNGHKYYLFAAPHTHTNQKDRPHKYAEPKDLEIHMGQGSNRTAKLLPEVMAQCFRTGSVRTMNRRVETTFGSSS
jgi:hypothetical protein